MYFCCIKYKFLETDLMFQIVMCIFSLLTKKLHKFPFSWTLGDSDCVSRALTMLNPISLYQAFIFLLPHLNWLFICFACFFIIELFAFCFPITLKRWFHHLLLFLFPPTLFIISFSNRSFKLIWIQVWHFYLSFHSPKNIELSPLSHTLKEISILFRF